MNITVSEGWAPKQGDLVYIIDYNGIPYHFTYHADEQDKMHT